MSHERFTRRDTDDFPGWPDHKIVGPDMFHPNARVFSEAYGGKMGIRPVIIKEGDQDVENWYPNRKGENMHDIDQVREIQERAFHSYGPRETMRQVLLGRGTIYVDQDLDPNKRYVPGLRIYQIILTQGLDMDKIFGELETNDRVVSEGIPHYYAREYNSQIYFIDHHGLGDDYALDGSGRKAELFELAKDPRGGNIGITKPFLRMVKKTHEHIYGSTFYWSIVRANNIKCMKVLQESFGDIAITRRQAPPNIIERFHSKETNFGLNTGIEIRSDFMGQPHIWRPGDPKPQGEDFLIRMPQGNQTNLESWWPHFQMLEDGILPVGHAPEMGVHYVGKALNSKEVDALGIDSQLSSYLAFTMNWKNR